MTRACMRFVALAGLVIITACGSVGSDTRQGSPSPVGTSLSPSTSPSASPSASSKFGFVFRTWDGTAYGLELENSDGSGKMVLSGSNFAHPDLLRFVESRNRRWAAWANGGDLLVAASTNLSSATTVVTSGKSLSPLAVSDDGATVAYVVRTTNDPTTMASELHVVYVQDRSTKLLHTFSGPFINCLGDGAFDALAQRLIAVGCGSGQAAGLVLMSTSDGSIISEDDQFFAWPDQWAFSQDLKSVWLINDSASESDIVLYDVATRSRQVLYRSPVWHQSDGSAAPNLPGFLPLSPDGSKLVFTRYPPDRSAEIYVISSAGGPATMIFKSNTVARLESWAPDGASVAVNVDNSTPTQRVRLVDVRSQSAVPIDTGKGFAEFLAWVVA